MTHEEYVQQNTHKGFDELALDLDISKDEAKKIWNKLDLGWHLTPRTTVKFDWLGHNKYKISDEVVVFLAPATPVILYKGAITDFASIPRAFRWLIDKDDKGVAIAALVHDILYATEWVDRRTADAIFLQLMKHRRAPWWKRTLAHMAVRLGGGFVWKKHKKEKVAQASRDLLAAVQAYSVKQKFAERALEI